MSHFAEFRVITIWGAVRAATSDPAVVRSRPGNVSFVGQDGDDGASVNVNFAWTIAAWTIAAATTTIGQRTAPDV
jgi:hypothetical protein